MHDKRGRVLLTEKKKETVPSLSLTIRICSIRGKKRSAHLVYIQTTVLSTEGHRTRKDEILTTSITRSPHLQGSRPLGRNHPVSTTLAVMETLVCARRFGDETQQMKAGAGEKMNLKKSMMSWVEYPRRPGSPPPP